MNNFKLYVELMAAIPPDDPARSRIQNILVELRRRVVEDFKDEPLWITAVALSGKSAEQLAQDKAESAARTHRRNNGF